MKKIYLLALCAFLSTQAWSQAPVNALVFLVSKADSIAYSTKVKDSFYVAHHVDSTFALPFTVKNTTTSALDFTWLRTVGGTQPAAWEIVICDPVACYAPATSTAKFNLISNGKGSMIVDAFTNGAVGVSYVQLKFTAKGYAAQTVKIVFKATKSSVGVNDAFLNRIAIAPNPVQDNFRLLGFDTSINQLQVMDMTGRMVRHFEAAESNYYDISDLEKGTYFVNLLDKNGNRLGSKKLVKVN